MGGKFPIFIALILSANPFLMAEGLKCLKCDVSNYRTERAALNACRNGASETCAPNQQSCQTQTRFNNGRWSVDVRCQQPSACRINHRQRDCSLRIGNSVCRYCCNFDKCIKNEKKTIKAKCKPLPDIQNGVKRCVPSEGALYSRCTFRCNGGFVLSGPKLSVCRRNSNGVLSYSNRVPTCKNVKRSPRCSPLPSSPANGGRSCAGTGEVGTVCTFTCDAGYELSGDSSTACQSLSSAQASWTQHSTTCVKNCSPCDFKPCDPNASCQNEGGKNYSCACNSGFVGNGKYCRCTSPCLSNNCDANAECEDVGCDSYKCTCKQGYEGDGNQCTKINPCTNNICHKNARCVPGKITALCYTCVCLPGYIGNGIICEEIDVCRYNDCHEHGTCIPNEAKTGYVCRCKQGYKGDGHNCQPICRPRPMDLVFVIDGSASVHAENFQKTKDAVKNIVSHLASIGSTTTQVAVIQYGKTTRQEFSLRRHNSKDSIEQAIDEISYMHGGRTETGKALKMLERITFTVGQGARLGQDVAQVAIVITDGRATDSEDLKKQQKAVKDAGIEVYAIGVGNKIVDAELLQIASEPKISHRFDLENYDKINELYSLLQKQICDNATCTKLPSVPDFGSRVCVGTGKVGTVCNFTCNPGYNVVGSTTSECAIIGQEVRWTSTTPICIVIKTNPCLINDCDKNAVCIENPSGNSYHCDCNKGYTGDGRKCTKKCNPRPMDVVFVVDGSGSVGPSNFDKVKEALDAMVNILVPDGGQSTQIGLIQYGSDINQEFALNQYNTKAEITQAIDGIIYAAGSTTLTGAALKELHTTSFTSRNGARTSIDVKKIAIVITDGQAADEKVVEREQKIVKDTGIEVFTVGVGDNVDESQLNLIASELKQKHVFKIESYSRISESLKSLTEEICDDDLCSNLPLTPANGGRNCTGTGKVGTTCVFTCDTGFKMNGEAQTRCEMIGGKASWSSQTPTCTGRKCHPHPKDVVFVVDGSGSVRASNFEKTKEALKSMVNILVPDGDHTTQIGLIQYGSDVTQEFALDQYNTTAQIDQAIDGVVYDRGTSTLTGAALKELHTTSFTPQNGARSGHVKKIAIVITDGRAADKRVVYTEQEIVKAAGIEVFAVGVGDSVDKAELNLIASDPTQYHVLEIKSYSRINESLKSLTEEICDEDICSGLPVTPTNGVRDCNGTGKVGTTCVFTCDTGFVMIGQAQTICLMIRSQASWSSQTPTCVLIKKKEPCRPRLMDIVFVLDGSRSVWPENFKKMKEAVINVTNHFASIGSTSTEVGVVQFGEDVQQEFAFGEYQTRQSLANAIDSILYMKGESTQTGLAMKELVSKTFTTQNGARMTPDVAKVAIIITDGEPTEVEEAREWQQKVKDSGIEIFAIGVGNRLNDTELRLMASEPEATHTYKIGDFSKIGQLYSLLKKEICGQVQRIPNVNVTALSGNRVLLKFGALRRAEAYRISINGVLRATAESSEAVNGYITKVFDLQSGSYVFSIVPIFNEGQGAATEFRFSMKPQVSSVQVKRISGTEYRLKFKALNGASRYYFYVGSSTTAIVVDASQAVNGVITKTLTRRGSSSFQIRIVPEFNGIKGVATIVTVQSMRTEAKITDISVIALSGNQVQLKFRALSGAEAYQISIDGVLRATVQSSEAVNGFITKVFELQGSSSYVISIVPVINGRQGTATEFRFQLRKRVDTISFETVSDTEVKVTFPFGGLASPTVYHITVNDSSSTSATVRSSDAVNGYATKTFTLPTGYYYQFAIMPEVEGRRMPAVTHTLLLGYCAMPTRPLNSHQHCLKKNGVLSCLYQCIRGRPIGPTSRECRMSGGQEHWNTSQATVCAP